MKAVAIATIQQLQNQMSSLLINCFSFRFSKANPCAIYLSYFSFLNRKSMREQPKPIHFPPAVSPSSSGQDTMLKCYYTHLATDISGCSFHQESILKGILLALILPEQPGSMIHDHLIYLSGIEGSHCDIDTNECGSSPCQNHGHCVDMVNNYQ